MKLAKIQYDNIWYIDLVLRSKYPQFAGFNGSSDDMQAIGLEESAVLAEIAEIDFQYADALRNFSVTQFSRDLNEAFSGVEALAIMPYYAVIKDLAAYKNFSGIKQLIANMLKAEIVNEDTVKAFKDVLLKQSINLDAI